MLRVSRNIAVRFLGNTRQMSSKRVALVLSGNGVYDGTECTEGIAAIVHLSRAGANVQCFAPDVMQMHAVNHLNGSPHDNNRNVMEESARLARGQVKALSEYDAGDFDALVFPGGFGAAKNLSNWATEGVKATLNADVSKAITATHSAKKPIGACCIAPTLLALALRDSNARITVGSADTSDSQWPYAGTAGQVTELGVQHVPTSIAEVVTDESHRLVTAPAYMYEGKPHEVFDSVGKMVDEVLRLA